MRWLLIAIYHLISCKREWNNFKLASDFTSYIHYIHILLACPRRAFQSQCENNNLEKTVTQRELKTRKIIN